MSDEGPRERHLILDGVRKRKASHRFEPSEADMLCEPQPAGEGCFSTGGGTCFQLARICKPGVLQGIQRMPGVGRKRRP